MLSKAKPVEYRRSDAMGFAALNPSYLLGQSGVDVAVSLDTPTMDAAAFHGAQVACRESNHTIAIIA